MRAVVCLGSNADDKEKQVSAALGWLGSVSAVLKKSDIYSTPECHGGGSVYFNAVAEIDFDGDSDSLNSIFKRYEIECGRNDKTRALNIVPIDIDIVISDNEIVRPRDYAQSFFKIGYNSMMLVVTASDVVR